MTDAEQHVLDCARDYGRTKVYYDEYLSHLDNRSDEWVQTCKDMKRLGFYLTVAAVNLARSERDTERGGETKNEQQE